MATIEFSPEEYERLLSLVTIGSAIGAEVLQSRGQEIEHVTDLEQKLLAHAELFGVGALVHAHGEHLDLSHEMGHGIENMIDEFSEQRFWRELAQDLGERDFLEKLPLEDRKEIERTGDFPETVAREYEKYAKEFDEHGVLRLSIDKKRT